MAQNTLKKHAADAVKLKIHLKMYLIIMKIAANTTKCIFTKMLAQCPDYMLDNIGFESWEGQEIFLSSKSCRLALGPTQFPIQWVPWTFPRGKVAGHDVNYLFLLVLSLRMSGALLPLPHMPSCHGQGQMHLYFIS